MKNKKTLEKRYLESQEEIQRLTALIEDLQCQLKLALDENAERYTWLKNLQLKIDELIAQIKNVTSANSERRLRNTTHARQLQKPSRKAPAWICQTPNPKALSIMRRRFHMNSFFSDVAECGR